jgi:hypothetical protein
MGSSSTESKRVENRYGNIRSHCMEEEVTSRNVDVNLAAPEIFQGTACHAWEQSKTNNRKVSKTKWESSCSSKEKNSFMLCTTLHNNHPTKDLLLWLVRQKRWKRAGHDI